VRHERDALLGRQVGPAASDGWAGPGRHPDHDGALGRRGTADELRVQFDEGARGRIGQAGQHVEARRGLHEDLVVHEGLEQGQCVEPIPGRLAVIRAAAMSFGT
jgi:hypothetical protein